MSEIQTKWKCENCGEYVESGLHNYSVHMGSCSRELVAHKTNLVESENNREIVVYGGESFYNELEDLLFHILNDK